MQPEKRKIELRLPNEEIADFFARFGKELESGAMLLGAVQVDLTGVKKIELSLKKEADGVRAKIKMKYAKPEIDEDDDEECSCEDPVDCAHCAEASEAAGEPALCAHCQEKRIAEAAPPCAQCETASQVAEKPTLCPECAAAELADRAEAKAEAKAEAEATRKSGKPSYKSLKKRMKGEWKTVKGALALGNLPPKDVALAFVESSKLMCSYAGYGDEFYPPYLAATEAFAQAVESGDAAALKGAALELDNLKKACHERYK